MAAGLVSHVAHPFLATQRSNSYDDDHSSWDDSSWGDTAGVSDYAYCLDVKTGLRAEDDKCPPDGSVLPADGQKAQSLLIGGYRWYFVSSAAQFPAVGERAHGGTTSIPGGRYSLGGLGATGGGSADSSHVSGSHSVSHGGFGGSSSRARS